MPMVVLRLTNRRGIGKRSTHNRDEEPRFIIGHADRAA